MSYMENMGNNSFNSKLYGGHMEAPPPRSPPPFNKRTGNSPNDPKREILVPIRPDTGVKKEAESATSEAPSMGGKVRNWQIPCHPKLARQSNQQQMVAIPSTAPHRPEAIQSHPTSRGFLAVAFA